MMKTTTVILGLLLVSAPGPARADAPSATLEAATDSWSVGVAPRVGLTVPTSKLGPMVVGGLAVDVALPVLDGRLVVALDGTITRPSADGSVNDDRIGGAGDYDVAVTEAKVGLDVIYRVFGPERSLIPFVGAGPVLHMLRTTQTTSFAPGENTAQSTEIGFELLGGADFRVGPGYVLGEARVVYSNLDHLFTGNTNAGNVMISAGYRVVF
jgi:hypothetical protein